MNAQKAIRGISLSEYATTLGEEQRAHSTRDIERKLREDHFIRPMWLSPEELAQRRKEKKAK